MAIELVPKRAVLQTGADDVLNTSDVEAQVILGQLGVEKLPDALKQLLGCHVEGGGGQGCEGALQGPGDAVEDGVFPVWVVDGVGGIPCHYLCY